MEWNVTFEQCILIFITKCEVNIEKNLTEMRGRWKTQNEHYTHNIVYNIFVLKNVCMSNVVCVCVWMRMYWRREPKQMYVVRERIIAKQLYEYNITKINVWIFLGLFFPSFSFIQHDNFHSTIKSNEEKCHFLNYIV